MATIFEAMMNSTLGVTEGVRRQNKKAKLEAKKISYKNIKVESKKIFEEEDIDEIDAKFNLPEEGDEDSVVIVLDPETPADAEIPEDAAEKMIGDEIYKCPVCGSNYVCDCEHAKEEGLEVDADGVPVECPICGDDSAQILVGEIAPAEEDAGEESEMDAVDADEGEKQEEEHEEDKVEEESLTESLEDMMNFTVYSDEYFDGVDFLAKDAKEAYKKFKEFAPEEEVLMIHDENGDEYDLTDFTMNEEVSEECPECHEDNDAMEFALNVPEEVKEDEEKEESPAVVIKDSDVELVLDDAKFESLMTKMIRDNYKGSPEFKVEKCSRNRKGLLKIEYVVREGSKSTKGILVGEGLDCKTRVNRIRFTDKGVFTESFAKTPSFVVECVRFGSTIKPVSMSYDFKVKVNESLYRVKGEVRK